MSSAEGSSSLFSSCDFKFLLLTSVLIHPAVGARWRVLVFVHVNLEALFIALHLPVGNRVAHAVEEGAAAQINVADQHATEVAQVTDVVSAESEGAEKFQHGHGDYKRAHAHLDGNGEHD